MWQKEQVIDELQKRGKRITEQRNMLLDVILAGNWARSIDINYIARKTESGQGVATDERPVGKPGESRGSSYA